jgi:hypothetical protein
VLKVLSKRGLKSYNQPMHELRELFNNHWVKVGAGLIIGLVAIMYMNPPHTPCQSQIEFYKKSIGPLFKPYQEKFKFCKEHADPGGCVPFFDVVGRLEVKLREVGSQCQQDLTKDAQTKSFLTNTMEVFVRAAWGSKPPPSFQYRNGWLELSQVVQFCKLRKHLITIYGEDEWLGFINEMLGSLPEAQAIGRTEAWNRSLVSDPCKYTF